MLISKVPAPRRRFVLDELLNGIALAQTRLRLDQTDRREIRHAKLLRLVDRGGLEPPTS